MGRKRQTPKGTLTRAADCDLAGGNSEGAVSVLRKSVSCDVPMKTTPVRVLLDCSAFHGERFDVLTRSPLRSLAASGRVRVFLTPIFIDETISAYGATQATDEWRAHLRYAVDVCNGGLMLTRDDIWRNELVNGHGKRARYTFPEMRTKRYGKSNREWLDTLRALATKRGKELTGAWMGSEVERAETHRKKNAQRALLANVRKEAAAARRVGRRRDVSFQQYLGAEFLPAGRAFMGLVDSQRRVELGDLWATQPERYPFYSTFIEGTLYSGYYAMIEQNDRLDRNAQSDYEQLAYLVWADAMVSNEQRFLRKAFDAIWKPRGKRLLMAEDVADHLIPTAASEDTILREPMFSR